MPNPAPCLFFFSFDKPRYVDKPLYNQPDMAYALLWDFAKQIGAKVLPTAGVYKGVPEAGYSLSFESKDLREVKAVLRQLCLWAGQESILYVKPGEPSYAYFVDCATGQVGEAWYWVEATQEQALAAEGFTLVNNQFYVVTKDEP